MLRLKRVELQGFKSFCERTELKFNGGGIAAIVGPNGCGKSNLSDAISWVLGEQSAKTLRGARMEDVIFAGTRDRKPLGMASVTMTLVDPVVREAVVHAGNGNGNGTAAISDKPGEVTITRRLFRSGESEYLIDGHTARLRDIQDLFMGTGLGPESYAIIEQGRIGQILSSKPQDRRAIIEEAAGITRFKTRKRLAEAKLESARQNLARVFDILEEVTRQVNSLKRQAAKARRYGELKTELDGKLRLVLAARFRLLEREAAKAALDLNLASAELRRLSEEAERNDGERGRLQNVCYETDALLTAERGRLAETQLEAERTRGTLAAQVRESGAIEERMIQCERESVDLDARAATLHAERTGHEASVAELDQEIARTRAVMAETNTARESLQGRLRQQETGIESGRLEVLRLLGEGSALQQQLAQIDEYLAGMERDAVRVRKEDETATAEIERLSAAKAALSQALARRQMELETVTHERHRTEEDLATQKATSAELRGRIETLREEFSGLKARETSLRDVLSHRSYTTDSVRRLFGAQSGGDAAEFRPLGVLADFVEVSPQYERAAEEFLHDELEYVVVDNWEQAERGMSVLRGMEGRATFLVEGRTGEPQTSADAAGPDLPRLTDYLRLTNGLTNQSWTLLPRLANCHLAGDPAEAQRLAAQYPELYFLAPEGACYHGCMLSGGKKTASGPLALKRELRELAGALSASQQALDTQLANAEELERRIAEHESSLERLRVEQQDREKDALALDHEMRKQTEETARTNTRLSVARLELARLTQERERSLIQRESNSRAVGEKETLRAQREEALEFQRLELESLEAEAGCIGEQHAALRVALAGLEERHRAARSAFAQVDTQWREVTARHQDLRREIERLGEERARLLSDNIELDRRSQTLAEEILRAEGTINQMAIQATEMRAALLLVDEALRQLRGELDAAHQKRSEIEIDLVKKQADLKYLDETSRKELNAPVDMLAQADEVLPEGEALDETERAYQELMARIEGLGPINAQALEEYQESQQRQDFLSAQRQDLIDSIRDTEKAIQDIDEVSRRRFTEAFEAINAHFREMFVTLFGGGLAEMRLTDETNVIDSGIDIVASPPGKKLQSVLLLSGGEKALAALALLMAVFRYQPSPFCVLDEVDAPLDEANIARLTRLLEEMSSNTQFILITHSKRTMESAEAMYGVTMQEPGVSKLVSVKFKPVPVAVAMSA